MESTVFSRFGEFVEDGKIIMLFKNETAIRNLPNFKF